jgi:hypothetical protein
MRTPSLRAVEQRFVRPEDAKLWPQAHLHTQWPGAGEPGDAVFEQFYASQVPSVADFAKTQALNRDADVAARLERISPARPTAARAGRSISCAAATPPASTDTQQRYLSFRPRSARWAIATPSDRRDFIPKSAQREVI